NLLLTFEDVVHVNPGDSDLLSSFDALVDEHLALIDSLEELKERLLQGPSESLLISDIELLNGAQKLLLSQIELRASSVSLSAAEAEELINSTIEASKLLH